MTGTLLSFCVMAVSIRALSGTLSIVEILTGRAGVGIAIIVIVLAARPELCATIGVRRLRLHLVRNSIHFGAQYLWALSLLLLPLATVFALEFTMPAWTILLAPIFLGERMTASRVGEVVLGLAGVLVILRPGIETFQPAALLVLAAALGYATEHRHQKADRHRKYLRNRGLDECRPARVGHYFCRPMVHQQDWDRP